MTTGAPERMATNRSLAVRTAALSKRFDERTVVDAVDLAIPRGIVSGLVGPNGAGKTTTLRMLLGLVVPTSGDGEILGAPLATPAAYLDRVGALIEAPAFYAGLSGRRNLELLAELGGHDRRRVDALLADGGLTDQAGDRYRSYSLGMKQRLGIAAALLPNPELLILDEPTNGLDPEGIREIRLILRRLADAGLTIVVSSHRLDEIQSVCDHLVIMDGGRLLFQGDIKGLVARQRPEVVAVPADPADRGRVVALAREAGYDVRVAGDRIHIVADPEAGAALNAAAAGAGITLAAIWPTHGSLEDAYFALTAGMVAPGDDPATGPPAVIATPAARAPRGRPRRLGGVVGSEAMKLWRPLMLLGGGVLLLGFIALVTVLALYRVTGDSLGAFVRPAVIAELSAPDGLVLGLKRGGPLMGIVVLGIFAAAFGSEYTTGTLRNLLVREPRRLEYLSGKYVALIAFGTLVVLLAALVSIAIAFAVAPGRGISTSAWLSSAGLAAVWSAIWHLILAALGFGTLGAALAIVLRSPVAALAIGVAWVLPAESMLASAWDSGKYWLPGQLLQTLAVGGTGSVSLERTLITLGVYWVVIATGVAILFVRRDVTA
jgi:ABC-2 type transport system ATP-binding protein